MIRRPISLIVCLIGGYFLGSTLTWLVLLPAARLLHLAAGPILTLASGGSLLGMVAGFFLWRRRPAPSRPSAVHGSARWSTTGEVRAALGGSDGLIVGRENTKGGQLLRYAGPQHLMTIAPTRSGKGVGAIIPNLLTADRSILCVDPKGENARIAVAARLRFGPVHVLDHFGVTGGPSAAFNPLDALDENSPELAEDAALLADALVHDAQGHSGDAHWNEEAKALIAGVILHVVCHEPPCRRNLAIVRELLTSAPAEFSALLSNMQKSTCAGGLVSRAANRHLGKAEREAAGVLSSAQRHTHFLDSGRMAGVLAQSDFRFEDLKAETCTVFLVLPPDRLATHSRWLRLLIAQAIGALARASGRPAKPVLLLLDEFAALGRLEPLEQAFGLMAGYGLQLWPILQDLHQLRSTYGQRAGTFLSNAGLIQIFNVSDVETASWVSKSIGAATMAYQTAGSSVSRGGPFLIQTTTSNSISGHLTRRELLTPDEVMRLDASLEILLRPGAAPVAARKVRYYADPEFQIAGQHAYRGIH